MAVELPQIPSPEFERRLTQAVAEPLEPRALAALHCHYRELRRWNRRLALVGPGTREEVVERHYGESLAALPWLLPGDRRLMDLGSGAGFPGLVLAAARPGLRVTVVEAREKKWAFLEAAADRCGLSVRCVNATVGAALPGDVPTPLELVTVRAVRLEPRQAAALARASSPGGRLWIWSGRDEPSGLVGWSRVRQVALTGSRHRRLIEYRRSEPPS